VSSDTPKATITGVYYVLIGYTFNEDHHVEILTSSSNSCNDLSIYTILKSDSIRSSNTAS